MNRKNTAKIWLVAFLFLLFSVAASLCWGQMKIAPEKVAAFFCRIWNLPFLFDVPITEKEQAVIWYLRLPRTLVGLLVGAGLGTAGAVLQGIFANPLVGPGIIGISSGAALGAVIAICLGYAALYPLSLPAFAFGGAILTVAAIIFLAFNRGRIETVQLLLSGVVISIFLGAVASAILTNASEQQVQQYLFWTVGGLDYRRWIHVEIGFFPIALSLMLAFLLSRQLNVLVLGEVNARAIGMRVGLYRVLFLAIASLLTASSVCISGNIGFVGLVVPHMVRLLAGPDHRSLLPLSAILGAAFLVLCDAVGRVILPNAEIRVGIMTAFIGTPYFLYLLKNSRKKSEV